MCFFWRGGGEPGAEPVSRNDCWDLGYVAYTAKYILEGFYLHTENAYRRPNKWGEKGTAATTATPPTTRKGVERSTLVYSGVLLLQ